MKPHWYLITYFECPVCGRSEEIRERKHGPKPENWNDRHEYVTDYDYCNVL